MILDLDNVTKRFRAKKADKIIVENLSFTLDEGVNIGILGKNGSGKSTLLRMLAGVESPDSGRIARFGSVSWPIAFSGFLHGSLTGRENARFIARIYGKQPDEIETRCAEFAEIGQYFDMPLKTYSSGMRARVAFSLSMAIDFDVQLIDEVMAVGDDSFQQKCKRAMEDRAQKSTFIIVAHQSKTLEDWCHVGAVLNNGKLVFYDTIKEAIHAYKAL